MATMETFVAGEFEGGIEDEGRYRVEIIVPRLLIKVSPEPVIRKKPATKSHMIRSLRKRRVSLFRTRVFLRPSNFGIWS